MSKDENNISVISETDPDATFTLAADDGETAFADTSETGDSTTGSPEISYHFSKGESREYKDKAATKEVELKYTGHMIDETQIKDDPEFRRRVNQKAGGATKSWLPIVLILAMAIGIIIVAFLFIKSQDKNTYAAPRGASTELFISEGETLC